MKEIVLGGIKVEALFYVVEDGCIKPTGSRTEQVYDSLVSFTAQAAPALSEAWGKLREDAAAPPCENAPEEETPTLQ